MKLQKLVCISFTDVFVVYVFLSPCTLLVFSSLYLPTFFFSLPPFIQSISALHISRDKETETWKRNTESSPPHVECITGKQRIHDEKSYLPKVYPDTWKYVRSWPLSMIYLLLHLLLCLARARLPHALRLDPQSATPFLGWTGFISFLSSIFIGHFLCPFPFVFSRSGNLVYLSFQFLLSPFLHFPFILSFPLCSSLTRSKECILSIK